MLDSRLEQGQVLLVSPAYWVSSVPPEDLGMPLLEAKPLLALLTAMVLAGLGDPVIHPEACDIGSLQGLSTASGEHVRQHYITPS